MLRRFDDDASVVLHPARPEVVLLRRRRLNPVPSELQKKDHGMEPDQQARIVASITAEPVRRIVRTQVGLLDHVSIARRFGNLPVISATTSSGDRSFFDRVVDPIKHLAASNRPSSVEVSE